MWSKLPQFVLPLAIIGCLLVFLVPLPPIAMDCLLAGNIAIGLVVLLTTLNVRSPLEFSVFPTVLLATTLARLVLNVATTRLILTRADTVGMSAAGDVVRQFGHYVSGDRLLVGIIIFTIIFVIQMLVITKGATRISEVAARFALDGVPGRQLAIDADLSSGAIDQAEARRRREQVNRQADFYGAMDGASKFVRGDAVAGALITLINILGGLFVGVVQGSMGIGEALEVYTKLTIGDGLVSQIPALLISLAAGLLVTRGSEDTDLPVEFLRQLFSKPEVLVVAGGFLGLLVFTNLPALPLMLLAAAFFVGAYFHRSWVSDAVTPGLVPAGGASLPQPRNKQATVPKAEKQRRIEDFLQVDPVELELGRNLVRLASAARNGDLLTRITRTREYVASDLGLVLPRVRVRDNLNLAENQYRVRFMGNLVAVGEIPKAGQLVVPPANFKPRMLPKASEYAHPGLSKGARLVSPDRVVEARAAGCQIVSPSQLISQHLRVLVYELSHELLTRDATQQLLDEVEKTSPAVVSELIPGLMKLGQVQQILQCLLREGVPIRQLSTILEALCDARLGAENPAELTERVRQRLGRTISARYADGDGRLHVVKLDPQLEQELGAGLSLDVLSETQQARFQESLRSAMRRLRDEHRPPILLTRSEIRMTVRQLAMSVVNDIVVLGDAEVTPDVPIRSVGIVGLGL